MRTGIKDYIWRENEGEENYRPVVLSFANVIESELRCIIKRWNKYYHVETSKIAGINDETTKNLCMRSPSLGSFPYFFDLDNLASNEVTDRWKTFISGKDKYRNLCDQGFRDALKNVARIRNKIHPSNELVNKEVCDKLIELILGSNGGGLLEKIIVAKKYPEEIQWLSRTIGS